MGSVRIESYRCLSERYRRKSFGMVESINFFDSVPDNWVTIEIRI